LLQNRLSKHVYKNLYSYFGPFQIFNCPVEKCGQPT
jgi:hypothetical protein